MSFDFDKEISLISKEIKEDENQLKKINEVYDQIPKNIINNISKEAQDSQSNLDSLINSFEIIKKIEKINEEENPKNKLNLLKSLLLKNNISNPYLKQLIITKLINKNEIKIIEESLLNINYPMFKGKTLMTTYEQLNAENKNDLELLSLYFEIYSYIANDIYKEFANYGTINKLILKNNENNNNNKFYFLEMISEFLFKKILATIFYNKNQKDIINKQNQDNMPGYQKKLSEYEKSILYEYEKLISYLNKSISNTSELFSLLINKANEDNKDKEFHFNKTITLKHIMSNLLEKLILFLVTQKTHLDLSNCSTLLMVLLIQKTNEQANEFIKNYQYDSFKNISLYDYIKYYINDNSTELKKRQKEFNQNVISKLKEDIIKEQNLKTYKTEDLLDYINMIIKDILSIYETFKTFSIIEELLMPSCTDILLIFKNYYENEVNVGINKMNLSLENSLFLLNLLYNYSLIIKKEFDSFNERINLFEQSIIDKISEVFENFKKDVDELFKDFITLALTGIRFNKISKLYEHENLKKGNNIEEIKKTFVEENDFWFKVKIILGKIKANRTIYKYIEVEVFKYFLEHLIKKVKYNIDKSDIVGNNLDVLIDKTKFFIEDNFLFNENDINDETKKKIQDLYLYLDNLLMNKK